MRKLKDYIELQVLTGMSDMEIIMSYFIDNDMEEDAMEVSHQLAKSKIAKTKHQMNHIREWAYYIPSEYLYEHYPIRTATILHRIELDFIVNGEVTGTRLEWAKENFPNIELPKVYFFPCVDWLEEQGIKFKDTNKE